MKIITNRLTRVCKENNILKGPNFAGLPGESTSEPIHLLNNICEDARENGKELWILFQDTAKAYDTISLEMLKRSLVRIKIPENIIELILEPFRGRQIQIITECGLTQTITAGDGIDQGETISPLLWRIFYDPLLCKIQENTNLGYTMESKWIADFSKPALKKENISRLQVRQAAIAYMDDTTWIARSKKDMESILIEAKKFYTANDSQINGEKSVLITINNPEKGPGRVQVGTTHNTVTELGKNEHTRFLGIWLGSKDHSIEAIRLVQEEIKAISSSIKFKKVTDKHMEYIINKVLIPRIEYRTQHCSLGWLKCNELSAQIRNLFRKKINIIGTIPNSVIHHKAIYNLKNIWENQRESQISNLIGRLNNTGPAGISTIIRLKQAQLINWEPKNILSESIPKGFHSKGNLSIKIIKTANNMGITIQSAKWNKLFNWKGGSLSIKTIMNDTGSYYKATPSLKNNNIMFVDQIIDKELKVILDWRIIQTINNREKGPIPKWYKWLKSRIAEEKGILKTNWTNWQWTDQHREFFSPHQERDDRKINWIAWRDKKSDTIIWGKGKGTLNKPSNTIQHYQLTTSNEPGYSKLIKCQGCDQKRKNGKNPAKQQACTIKIQKEIQKLTCTLFNKNQRLRREKEPEIPIEPFSLESNFKSLDKSHFKEYSTLQFDHVEINSPGIQAIEENISSLDYQTTLKREYVLNCSKENNNNFQFFTDGSLGKTKDQVIKMGVSWIQSQGPNIGRKFSAGISNWPSSYRAESAAIFLVTLVVPEYCNVEIVTDSQNCIDTFSRLSKPDVKRTAKRWMKEKNWLLWARIIDTIQKKHISVRLSKIKAHSGNKFNEIADKLAKEGKEEEEITWNEPFSALWKAIPIWNEIPIEISLRDFIKEYNKKEILINWTTQNRIQKIWSQEIHEQKNIKWNLVWERIRAGNSLNTSIKQNRERTFGIKMLHNELPTLDNLEKRRPDIYYRKTTCVICKEEKETLDHLLSCKSTEETRKQIWNSTTKKIIEKWIPRHQSKETQINRYIIEYFKDLGNKTLATSKNIINFSLGLRNTTDCSNWDIHLAKAGVSSGKAKIIFIKASQFFAKSLRKHIWNPRCEKIQEWEKELGISKTQKRSINPDAKKWKNSRTRTTNKIPRKKKEKSNLNQDKIDITERTKKTIWEWIKEGKKWLNM
jgi:ribonuclease HI